MRASPAAAAARIRNEAWALRQIARAGAIGAVSEQQLAGIVRAVYRYGALGGVLAIGAARFRDRVAVVDERGRRTFGELDSRSNALANHWRTQGFRPGDGVAILARNHRGFLDAVFAGAKCGARIILLNTDLGAAQLRDVVQREGADLLVYDGEYAPALADIEVRLGGCRAWTDAPAEDTLDAVIDGGDPTPPPRPGVEPKIILLTSGTTGTPKGAVRSEPWSLMPISGVLSKAPFRGGEVTECCAPMFHSLGFLHAVLAVLLGSTLVIRRRFDPQLTLRSLADNHATAMIVVPIMLRRLIDHDPTPREHYDLSSLRIVFVTGSQLGASLCTQAMNVFGPVIYNLYGSTEVAYATIATPADLAAEPGCVGGVVKGTVVKILDNNGNEVPPGVTGRIFVGSSVQFEGYTGGGTKESISGLMSSGDVGHFDSAGRLFVDGRDDEMIVSGGENVFPAEVEETLARHPEIIEAAAVGVPDDDYGQRLRCFIVVRDGAALTEQDVKDYVKRKLARFKVPRDVRFVDALPRNPTGKVLKRSLDPDRAARS